jgi:outer membrane protein assembly complex protein YaeT
MRAAPLRHLWFLALIFAMLLSAPVGARGEEAGSAPEAPLTLHSFKITGNKIIKTEEIKKDLSEKLPSFWPPWGKNPPFKMADLEYDVDRLTFAYQRYGFFHPQIKPEVNYGPKGQVDVVLVVKEGPWVKITGLHVKVVGGLDLSDLESKWPLNVGDRYAEKAYDALKNLYLNYLPNHGYPRVKVTGKILLDEDKNTAEIYLTVVPGPLCYFGKARLLHPEKLETPAKAITEKLTFKPGDIFNLEELFKTQRKLYATDLFRSVVLTPEEVPRTQHTIPISIELEEKKKRSLKMGVGYGDEDKIRAKLGMRYRNLGGGGRVLDLDSTYSSLGYKVEELFSNPVIFGTHFDLVNQSGARRRDLPGFTDKALYTQTRLERDLPYDFRFFVGHGLEYDRPYDVPLETLLLLGQTEKVYRASFLLLGVRQDTMDSHIEPKKGGLLSFSNEFAPSYFGSQMQFVQSVVDARRYQAIGDSGFVLAGRVKLGVIQPIQDTTDIPIYRRFFSGGANSVRGYKLDYLGPRNFAGTPVGGQALVEASIEGRFPLPIFNKKIGAVVFLDAGNVYFKIRDLDLGQLKYSPGFGLRYLSPIGAIGLDIGFPTNRINFNTDPRAVVHFNIGYGF